MDAPVKSVLAAAVFAAAGLFAAPPARVDPVAKGYPAWTGISDKSYIMGRVITPSDLRHKFTVVVEVEGDDADKLRDQLATAADICALNSFRGAEESVNWARAELPRDVMVVISYFGKNPEVVHEALKTKDVTLSTRFNGIKRPLIPVYAGVTFEGAPDGAGSRPFAYAMGIEGTTPIYSGAASGKAVTAIRDAIRKARASLTESGWKWRRFYGSVAEPKVFTSLAKAVNPAKPKPVAAEVAKLRKGIASRNEDTAREAQILFDALEQTKSDLMYRIALEAQACPHRAYYDMQELLKYWPTERKKVARYAEKIKNIPDADKLAKIFVKASEWADPSFECKNAGEARKIVAELSKMKKDLEKLKESKTIVIQNGALLLDGEIDDLISLIPSRVQTK